MAGLIAALTKRRAPSTPFDPALEGIGGDTSGPGPAGASGFPGSTSQTRTFRGLSPRAVKLESDTNSGFDQGSDGTETRQVGRAYSEGWSNPRDTPDVTTPRPRITASLRTDPREWFGGLPLRSDAVAPANDIVGGNPLMRAQDVGGHSTYDTETPRTARQPDISGGVPGSQNVRNTIAQRYKNPPGQLHTYQSRPRPDQAPVNPGGQATDGNVHPDRVVSLVTVPNRFVWGQGGVQTWSVERQMPYGSGERGDGARGADLNGTRYYAEGPPVNTNGGLGAYGVSRLRGPNHRPVFFSEPAPWTSQFYDTTASVGTPDSPGPGGQSPDAVYVSPDPGRGSLTGTGR
jgi:hypothetical protein